MALSADAVPLSMGQRIEAVTEVLGFNDKSSTQEQQDEYTKG